MRHPLKPALLSLVPLLLGACAVSDPQRSAVPTAASDSAQGTPAVAAPAHVPRTGVIESASVASLPSSSAGGTAPPPPTMAYRLRMDDGSTQSITLAGERFEVGDRVELTSDGRLIRR